jgi:Fur family ferric uptake transcriptional regulator
MSASRPSRSPLGAAVQARSRRRGTAPLTGARHTGARGAPEMVRPSATADSAPDARETTEIGQVELHDALTALGPAVTAPRRAIVEAMLAGNRLQTPEEIVREARTRAPATSLATVYRTLERLDAVGRIKRATLASGAVGYAYCPTGHHEHAICVRCGELFPIRPCLIGSGPAIDGFTVVSHVLDFYGVCGRCAAALQAPSPGSASAGVDDVDGRRDAPAGVAVGAAAPVHG